jgi:hypothetical protein
MWWPPCPTPNCFPHNRAHSEVAGGNLGKARLGKVPARHPWGAYPFKHEPYHLGSPLPVHSSLCLPGVGSWRPSWSSSTNHHARLCWGPCSCWEVEALCCGPRGRGAGRHFPSLHKTSFQNPIEQMTAGSNLTLAASPKRSCTTMIMSTPMPATMVSSLRVGAERPAPRSTWRPSQPGEGKEAQLCTGNPSPAGRGCQGPQ